MKVIMWMCMPCVLLLSNGDGTDQLCRSDLQLAHLAGVVKAGGSSDSSCSSVYPSGNGWKAKLASSLDNNYLRNMAKSLGKKTSCGKQTNQIPSEIDRTNQSPPAEPSDRDLKY
ncbi:hypothetical protein SETIT_9G218500v2 [Setaria italica]|uniref:Uncharacterized protein n=1 Tax=Setaria italica TaxID=4555 RepID=A0A368SJD6_SETIT|nr:hypothetical protein SETIT_9G218500v2 [Setaria italica]